MHNAQEPSDDVVMTSGLSWQVKEVSSAFSSNHPANREQNKTMANKWEGKNAKQKHKLGVYNLILKRVEHGWERLVCSNTGVDLPGGTPSSSGHTTRGLGDTTCGTRSPSREAVWPPFKNLWPPPQLSERWATQKLEWISNTKQWDLEQVCC